MNLIVMYNNFLIKTCMYFIAFILLVSCVIEKNKPASAYFGSVKVIQLAEAAADGDIKKMEQLIKAGVDVNTVGKYGVTPLMFSVIEESYLGCDFLLKSGANPHFLNDMGVSPLSTAVVIGNMKIIKSL